MKKNKCHLLYFCCFFIICGMLTSALGDSISSGISSPAKPNKIIHVDAVFGSNSNEGISRQNALLTIQYAVSLSRDGDTIVAWPGVYNETVDFAGKAITITSGADAAVITNPAGYGVRFHAAEDSDSILKNFVIRDCIIAVQVENSSPAITNVTVVQNAQGIIADGVASPDIANSIFWSNQFGDLVNCEALYSWKQGSQGSPAPPNDGTGLGSPMFADPNSNDFHLRSERGRFFPEPADQPAMYGTIDGLWALDKVTSPCIDIADPDLDPALEGYSNGGRQNIGAYGGTPYASKSQYPLVADFNHDGIVDLNDFALFTSQWLDTLPWHY